MTANNRFKGPKRKKLNGQQLILDAIIDHWGGPSEVAKHINQILRTRTFTKQVVSSWKIRSGVPLKDVYKIANVLEVDIEALNYKAVEDFYGKDEIKDWKEVVEDCVLLNEIKRAEVLRAKKP